MPQPYPNGELVIVIDCADLDVSARFWSGVLGYTAGPPAAGTGEAGSDRYRGLQPDSGADGNEFCVLHPPGMPSA